MRFLVAVAAAAMLANSAGAAIAADPLDIPAILPVTGPAAFLGKEFSDVHSGWVGVKT